jgi:hypothetical protein
MPEESDTPILPPSSPPAETLQLTGDSKREPHTGPKLTGKVRRGLALMRYLVCEAGTVNAKPTDIVARWPKHMASDFNTAMAWVEANERSQDGGE